MNEADEIKIAVGKNIRKARRLKGIEKLEEAARLMKIDEKHYGNIERGKANFSIDMLIKITKFLDVSLEELFMSNGNLLTLRFVISEHNITTLKEVIKIIKDLVEKKEA